LASVELQPSDGGCFELSADGKVVYSKLKSGEFPDEDAMVAEIGRLL
jgi:selenoprotein W-related protein